MTALVTLIGFGEAASAFATGSQWRGVTTTYDILTDRDATRPAQLIRYAATGVTGALSLPEALAGAPVVLSLVTADQALAVAEEAAPHLQANALFLDMNSVAPDTKRAAAHTVEAAGGRYVDVAVMAPVDPAGLAVPLLLSGPHAAEGAQALHALGFANVRILSGDVGRASSVKMIRSVMVKGIEALTAEMIAAANAAGVADEVLASLGGDWAAKAAYNLERMTTHGLRRAAEMEESAKTLAALGIDPVMTRGTVVRQREMAA